MSAGLRMAKKNRLGGRPLGQWLGHARQIGGLIAGEVCLLPNATPSSLRTTLSNRLALGATVMRAPVASRLPTDGAIKRSQ